LRREADGASLRLYKGGVVQAAINKQTLNWTSSIQLSIVKPPKALFPRSFQGLEPIFGYRRISGTVRNGKVNRSYADFLGKFAKHGRRQWTKSI
jgi:hypothetical protein